METFKCNTTEILKEMESHLDYSIHNGLWEYVGTLSNIKSHWIARRFLQSWADQLKRCNNPNHPDYIYYGKIGVQRIWNSRICVNWAINELLKRKNWIRPVISREGDKGNYELGNVKLLESSENSEKIKVTQKRRDWGKILSKLYNSNKSTKLTNIKNSSDYMIFESAKITDEILGKPINSIASYIYRNCNIIINSKKYKPEYITIEEYIKLSS